MGECRRKPSPQLLLYTSTPRPKDSLISCTHTHTNTRTFSFCRRPSGHRDELLQRAQESWRRSWALRLLCFSSSISLFLFFHSSGGWGCTVLELVIWLKSRELDIMCRLALQDCYHLRDGIQLDNDIDLGLYVSGLCSFFPGCLTKDTSYS